MKGSDRVTVAAEHPRERHKSLSTQRDTRTLRQTPQLPQHRPTTTWDGHRQENPGNRNSSMNRWYLQHPEHHLDRHHIILTGTTSPHRYHLKHPEHHSDRYHITLTGTTSPGQAPHHPSRHHITSQVPPALCCLQSLSDAPTLKSGTGKSAGTAGGMGGSKMGQKHQKLGVSGSASPLQTRRGAPGWESPGVPPGGIHWVGSLWDSHYLCFRLPQTLASPLTHPRETASLLREISPVLRALLGTIPSPGDTGH